MTRVKVCGITNLEDAMTCVDAGADALGFIFVEGTPRFVTPAQVAPIVRALPPFVTTVGVFWDHPQGHVKAVAEACGLSALQFHGDETPDDLRGYALPVIKTVKLARQGPRGDAVAPMLASLYATREPEPHVPFEPYRAVAAAILLDSAARWSEGDPREPIEWQTARRYASAWRVVLSAGLTPDNVAWAIETVRPYAVDVNSGVEARPGQKDEGKVRRFIAEARRT
jgi:phosphoribosylanthranilate isomerase